MPSDASRAILPCAVPWNASWRSGVPLLLQRAGRGLYEGGHLLKRIARIDVERHYEFEIVEQSLAFGGGLTLAGGCYTLCAAPGGGTEVAVTTRYVSHRRPRWLWQPIEAAVCHGFHRFLLSAMRRRIEMA